MTEHIHTIKELVARVLQRVKQVGEKRLLVCISGVPGAGKSTLVASLVTELETHQCVSKALPQDGYHLYRHQLQEMDDPEEAFRRRGAPFTFDGRRFVDDVSRLLTEATVSFPSFDHSHKDPVENDIVIGPDVAVVFIEGNYVGLAEEPWGRLQSVADQLWHISVAPAIVQERLIQRHLSSGICASLEEATERACGSDWQNAQYVMAHSRTPDVDISLE